MRVKLFTLRYTATLGGFDERPIQEFVRDKEVLAFREHFFVVNEVPHVVCVVTWQDALVPGEPDASAPRARKPARTVERPDPIASLDQAQRALFNALREWRAAKARTEGVPPYVIFTNRELADIVRARPEHRAALAALPGIGAAKVEKHAAEVLRIVGAPAPDPAP